MENNLNDEYSKIRELLDAEYTWPALYIFKFVVPKASLSDLEQILGEYKSFLTKKSSKTGKYISVTLNITMESTESVIDIYKKVKQVKGVMAL